MTRDAEVPLITPFAVKPTPANLFAGAYALAASSLVQAAITDDTATAPYTLGTVIVNATAAQRAGEHVESISTKQIDELGARTLDEALRATPGITINPGPQGIPRIMMRGLPPRETLLFLNGVPLNAAADGQFDPSLITTESISKIRVTEGVTSVLYGPGANAGVIDVITRRGTDGLHGGAGMEFGTGNARRFLGDISGGNDTIDYFVSASRTSSDGYPVPDGPRRANSDALRTNTLANLGIRAGDWRVGVTGTAVDGRGGLPPNTIASTASNPYTTAQQFLRLNDISGQSLQVDAAYAPEGPLSLRFSGYINHLRTVQDRYDNANYATMSDPTVQTYHQIDNMTVSGGRAQARYDLGALGSLTGALNYRQEQDDLSGFLRNVPVTAGSGSGNGGSGGGGRGNGGGTGNGAGSGTTQRYAFGNLSQNNIARTYSTALEYQVDPTERLHLTAGASHEMFDTSVDRDSGNQWMLGTTYDLTQQVQPYLSYSRKVRFATLNQLFDPTQGNAMLAPERSSNAEGGIAWSISPGNRVRIGVFSDRIDNFIQNDRTTQRYFNSNVTSNGAQVSGTFSLSDTVTIRPGYTYMHVYSRDTGARQDYRPSHVLNLSAAWQFMPTWRVSADVYAQFGSVVTSRSDATNQMGLGSYWLANVKIQKSFPASGVDVYLRATNLFDRKYDYAVGYPARGREVFAGVSVRF